MKELSCCLFSVCLLFLSCTKQEPKEPDPVRRKSPVAITKIQHAGTYIKIVYGQPYKNGRNIFGELIPYGEVWRTGANEATEIITTKDIKFAGQLLPAGTYALFTIPGKDTWTIILNSELGQWGAFEYNSGRDIMRVDLPATKTEQVTEAFTIQFGEVTSGSTKILMKWDQTVVRIPISFIGSGANATS